MIVFKHRGNFKHTERLFNNLPKIDFRRLLEKYGKEGVQALASNTPVDTGKTAASWGYEIRIAKGSYTISWVNSNIQNGIPIAILLQYDHATRTGGFVKGRDYINPSLQPIFDRIADEAWKEIKRL